jgi:GT2 family glycosyltransferase
MMGSVAGQAGKGPTDVLVVVVEYDRPDLTEQLLSSLDGDWPVVLVRTSSCLGPKSCRCETIDRPDNPGYAEAVNEGLYLGLARGFQFFFICNNDVLLEPGTIAALREALVQHPEVGAVSPIITFYPAIDRVWFAGGTLWGDMLVTRHPGYTGRVKTYPSLFPTEYLSGCALMVRRAVLEEVGLMPEGYFMYMEDVEWSLKMRRAGWTLAVLGKPLVHHVASASSGGVEGRLLNPLSARLTARNAWIVRRRLRLGRAFYIGQFLIRLPYNLLLSLAARRPDVALAYVKGLWEGMRC